MDDYVYEERKTTLRKGKLDEYVGLCRRETWPALAGAGGDLVCLLAGLIGDPAEDLLQVVRFPDVADWEGAQGAYRGSRAALVDREEARLLRSAGPRPTFPVDPGLRRPVYGYRRFLLAASDVDEFVHCSAEGLWPGIEPRGPRIFGLWRAVAVTEPQEMAMLTGYEGPAEWESSRYETGMPEGYDRDLWERALRLRARRNEITIRTWVRLMRAIEFAPGL